MSSAVPIVFDGCAGWFHPGSSPRAVVLCGPHGYEAMCAYRSWRALAEQLSAEGLPTLRFDYRGTGDSAGHDEEPDRVRAWVQSVKAAVTWLRTEAGVTSVALVGLRLGGTLAAAAAAELGGVDALALLAAPSSGKTYARELKALAMMAPPVEGGPPPRPEWKEDLEAAGFVLTAQTLADLKTLDLVKLTTCPAPRVLIFNRSDAPADPKLAAHLASLGAEVVQAPFNGYSELMRDAHFARPPHEVYAVLADWLTQGVPEGTREWTPKPGATLHVGAAEERAVFFGEGDALAGVFSRALAPNPRAPALLFLNTGSNHHIGSNRMWVALARQLAGLGFSSLRFDIAGVGESPAWEGKPDNRLYSKDSCADVSAALDWLQTHGHPGAVVLGLCSGAYLGFHTAIEEPRIVGQVLINAQRFVWNTGDSLEVAMRKSFKSTRFYVETALKPETWQRVASGEVNVLGIGLTLVERGLKRAGTRVGELRARLLGRDAETSEVARGFYLLCDRGVQTLLVYGAQDGGLDELDFHLGKGGKKLQGRANVRIEILEGADHTFTARWAREKFAGLLVEQLTHADLSA